jgi:succinoglycan biosynthesis protein ExoA
MNNQSISLICPTLNESEYIKNIITFFVDLKWEEKELIIIDGGSTDGTCEIVKSYQNKYNKIKLLNNPDKYVPFALNMAIKDSNGDIIIRLDAHTVYAENYVEKIVEVFNETGADIVGGHMNTQGENPVQKAVAYATLTKFGIGNSKLHDLNYSGFTDHVYLGAWKKELFTEVGYFDERMIRNQDDEFHYRAKSLGKKIYLSSQIKSYYYPRKSISKLFKQYFQYGEYKPLVLRKVLSEIKIRHFVPSLFAVYFFISLILLFYFPEFSGILVFYIAACIYFSLKIKEPFEVKKWVFLVYPTLHLSYGLGFIWGLLQFRKNWKN